jgi:biopolymer transport protein ExbD
MMRRRQKHAEVGTEALNDIMFFLLLFFLIVSTVANPNIIPIKLPQAKTTQDVKKKQYTLTVTEDKKYFIDQREIAYANLEQELTALRDANVDPSNPDNSMNIVLRVDKNLVVQDMVDVMQIGTKLSIKMVLATQKFE